MDGMNDYREKLYSQYASAHTSYLYGNINLDKIKKQFPVWDEYFGKHLPKNKGAKILDIGCGSGGFLYYLGKLMYKNCLGIDVSGEQVELAKKIGVENIKMADLRKFLKNKAEVYDVVLARDVLEHFTKDEALGIIEMIFNALRSEGKLIIQTLNGESPFIGRYRYGDLTHESAFTRASLSQIFRTIGFKKMSFYPAGPVAHGLKSAIRCLLWKAINLKIRAYILIETGAGNGIFTQNLIAVAEK